MHRFYLPSAESQGQSLTLTDREAHHALNVIRVRRGERVAVLDGVGHEFLCEVREAGRHSIALAVIDKKSIPPLPHQMVLIQAVAKGKAMDWIVQKATELGVHRIVPIITERTVAQVEEESAAAKVEKWQTIAIESIKQCGSPWLPRIGAPITLKAFLTQAEQFDLSLVGSLQGDAKHARQHFDDFRAERGRDPGSVCMWIGPEGDFTPAELHAIESAGARPITFGPLVLRSDTAAISALAVVNYELQAK